MCSKYNYNFSLKCCKIGNVRACMGTMYGSCLYSLCCGLLTLHQDMHRSELMLIPYSAKFWWGNILVDLPATAKNLPSKIPP